MLLFFTSSLFSISVFLFHALSDFLHDKWVELAWRKSPENAHFSGWAFPNIFWSKSKSIKSPKIPSSPLASCWLWPEMGKINTFRYPYVLSYIETCQWAWSALMIAQSTDWNHAFIKIFCKMDNLEASSIKANPSSYAIFSHCNSSAILHFARFPTWRLNSLILRLIKKCWREHNCCCLWSPQSMHETNGVREDSVNDVAMKHI
jgi:hypothetical protein